MRSNRRQSIKANRRRKTSKFCGSERAGATTVCERSLAAIKIPVSARKYLGGRGLARAQRKSRSKYAYQRIGGGWRFDVKAQGARDVVRWPSARIALESHALLGYGIRVQELEGSIAARRFSESRFR